jgi:Ca-activated chloride channel family protein
MVGAPLASAKRELLKGVSQLEKTHQFQIIFFNHQRRIFDLSGGQNRIPFATDRTKELAARFVGGITASGGTDRYAALWAAVGMRPDVIFFLTDADNPMTAAELERVRRRNGGAASIHCIEFGFGPPAGGDNFLKRLARQNSGSYVYVDTTQL